MKSTQKKDVTINPGEVNIEMSDNVSPLTGAVIMSQNTEHVPD